MNQHKINAIIYISNCLFWVSIVFSSICFLGIISKNNEIDKKQDIIIQKNEDIAVLKKQIEQLQLDYAELHLQINDLE